jgi:DNA-binding protein Fis
MVVCDVVVQKTGRKIQMINESDIILWTPGMSLSHIEKMVILKAFRHYRGNKSATATALGISVRTLDTRLEEYQTEKAKQQEASDEYRRKQQEFLDRQRNGTLAGKDREEGAASCDEARAESLAQISQKLKMSVSERKEVQAVLPSETHAARSASSGSSVQNRDAKTGSRVFDKGKRGAASGGSEGTGKGTPSMGGEE